MLISSLFQLFQDVALSVGDVETDSSQVSLQPGQRRSVSLSWTTSAGDAGNYRVSVSSATDSDSSDVAVDENRVSVTADNQRVADSSFQEVVVRSTYLPSSGFLVVYNASGERSPDSASIVGASTLLGGGEHENVRISLDERIAGSQTLTVVAHNDTIRNNIFDGAGSDTPFTVNGVPVNDTATLTVRTPTATPTATPGLTATPTATAATPESETAGEDGAGFGVSITVLALVSAGLLATRNRD